MLLLHKHKCAEGNLFEFHLRLTFVLKTNTEGTITSCLCCWPAHMGKPRGSPRRERSVDCIEGLEHFLTEKKEELKGINQ